MASGKVRGHDSELLWPLLKIYNFHTNFKFWFTKIKLWVGNMPFCLNGHYATIKFILYYMCTHNLIFPFQYHIQEQLKKPGVFKLWLILISTNVTFMPDLEDTCNQKHFAGCFIPFYTTKGSRADSENCSEGGGGGSNA